MVAKLSWKFIFILALTLGSIYLLLPTVLGLQAEREELTAAHRPLPWYLQVLPDRGINLGLDLKGGMYLEMDVEMAEAFANRLDILANEIVRFAKDEDIAVEVARLPGKHQLEAKVSEASKRGAFVAFMRKNYDDILRNVADETSSEDSADAVIGPTVVFVMTEKYENHNYEQTMNQVVEAVRNRIDRYGVAESSIRKTNNRVIVELPGVQDPDRVLKLIKRAGRLEFKLVDESLKTPELRQLVKEARQTHKLGDSYDQEVTDRINELLQEKIPENTSVHFELERDPITHKVVGGTPYLIENKAYVTGEMLKDARVSIQDNEPYVTLSFDRAGTKAFGDLTQANVGRLLAIMLDDVVNKAPSIEEPILGGEARITLGYGRYQDILSEAEDLTLVLREGALPARLTEATKSIVGPSLGQDSIDKGIKSILIAVVLVVGFMIFYYRWSGVIANIALLVNIIYIFGAMALLQASLTMPGLAGIVLTIGMAVDANVIIFERIKEEMRLDKGPRAAVGAGYANAMTAIIDSNVTTLIAGLVLYQFGTGPVKGFATTLMLGVLSSMFTAIVITRSIFDVMLSRRKIERISI